MVGVLQPRHDRTAAKVSGVYGIACQLVALIFGSVVALVVISLIVLASMAIPVSVYWLWSDSRQKMLDAATDGWRQRASDEDRADPICLAGYRGLRNIRRIVRFWRGSYKYALVLIVAGFLIYAFILSSGRGCR
jgi:hypothetical protein